MARIRTIKPEFWKNEQLSALPEIYHILAAALLNYADDEGYFNANPGLIKAECFPLREVSLSPHGALTEDSLSIHGGLTELTRIGYLSIGNSKCGKTIGWVVNFSKHQKISRASPSKFRGLRIVWDNSVKAHGGLTEDSVKAHGGLTEDSVSPHEKKVQEQGTGNREMEQGTGNVFSPSEFSKTSEPCLDSQPPGTPETTQGFANLEPLGLATHFRNAKDGGPNSQESLQACTSHFRAAIASGAKPEALLSEILSRDRNRAEPVWELIRRHTPRSSRAGPGAYGKPARLTPRQVAGGDP